MDKRQEEVQALDIKEVVRRANAFMGKDTPAITERTFRFWEAENLLSRHIERGEYNRKYYNLDVINEIRAIRELEKNYSLKVEDIKKVKINNNLCGVSEFLSYIRTHYSPQVLGSVIGLLKDGRALETIKSYDFSNLSSLLKTEQKIQVSRHGLSDLRGFIFDIRNKRIIKKVIIISPWITDLSFLEELLSYSGKNLFRLLFFMRNSNENEEAITRTKSSLCKASVYCNNSLHAKTYIVETNYGYRNFVYIGSSNFSKASSNLEEVGVVAYLNDNDKLYHEIKNVIAYLGGSKDTKSLNQVK